MEEKKGWVGIREMERRNEQKELSRMSQIEHERGHNSAGQHGFGPHGGEFHLKKGARISDRGSMGHNDRGRDRGELGSHSGARRNRVNPGSSRRKDQE